jgi:hypothetical protein|tara:strand:+ start:282 stop:494 length:213 start_codon:yes stop_codon:yes gene_type:complete
MYISSPPLQSRSLSQQNLWPTSLYRQLSQGRGASWQGIQPLRLRDEEDVLYVVYVVIWRRFFYEKYRPES